MFKKKFSKTYKNLCPSLIWQAWIDVANWPRWDMELDYCEIKEKFQEGTHFILKPKKGPKVKITLQEVIDNYKFVDSCQFIGAVMYDEHVLEETTEGVVVINTISVKGPLAFLWWYLVVKSIAKNIPEQTDKLIAYVRASQ